MDTMQAARQRIRNEANRLLDATLRAAERHYAAETPWFYSAYWLGIPSVAFSAIASVALLSKLPHGNLLAGFLSIAVAVLSALNTFLDPHKKASAYHLSAKGYEALYHTVGYFYRVESLSENVDVATLEQRLGHLMSDFKKLNEHSLPISGRAYRVADAKIRDGSGEVVGGRLDLP